MKIIFSSALLAILVVASSAVSPRIDGPSDDRSVVAQRFCPNGRC